MASDGKGCPKDSTKESNTFGVDDILTQIGEFGKFQRYIYIIIFLVTIFHNIISVGFVFTASPVVYRCRIPECDKSESLYEKPWTDFSIPKTASGKLDKCQRYKAFNSSKDGQQYCNAENYDQELQTDCGHDFIFRDKEVTISNDFKIFCSDEWKLAMVGTINNLGQFIGIPLGGLISDRYGRRLVIVCGTFISAVLGTARSFSPNYTIFLILGFLDNLFGSSLYATVFVLGLEIVGPKARVPGCTFIGMCTSIGSFLLAVIAKYFHDWRLIERAFYIPALGFIILPLILPESFRWLLSQGKEDEAIKTLQKAAKINKRELFDSSIQQLLKSNCQNVQTVKTEENNSPIIAAFKIFPWRIINCSLCWFTNVMVFYGLNLNLDLLGGGDKYNNFMFVILIEIPALLLPFLTINRFGRRYSIFGFMLLSGVFITVMNYVSSEFVTLQLMLYLLGKMTITASFQTLYFFTSEAFPTSVRNSLLSFCSMVGRFGSMVAPQTPLMAKYYASAPALLFASCAILSGSLALFLPETKDIVLPSTLEEAEKMGQKDADVESEIKEKLLKSKV
ncbi:solute carrier family 22 member 3-like [Episyrphus balteatus]|uniref:solute carrier family 22 member 3-like n=1 Tax=Episyrphus balteatus TaxID=286459 RepID=UPI0024868BD0|nr:solute carrier family 22 member 3-like [Episyrphus balteatus]